MHFISHAARFRFLALALAIVTGATDAARAKDASSPLEVVQAYADAANRHDLEGFLALYAPNITKYQFPATVLGSGLEHYREKYQKSFAAKPDIRVEIVSIIALGDKVVSRDRVTGLPGGKTADELTIYEVHDGKITKIVYVERQEHGSPN
jgi:hypothetical protein